MVRRKLMESRCEREREVVVVCEGRCMVIGSRDCQAGQALCASVYFYATGAGGEKVTQNLVSY